MKNKKNKDNTLIVIGILILTLAIIGASYAIYQSTNSGNQNKINTGTITFSYKEGANGLNITSDQAISDADGKVLNDYFAFNVSAKATGTVNVSYYIYFTPVSVTNQLSMDDVKLYLSKVTSENTAIVNETQVVTPTKLSGFTPFDTTTFKYASGSSNYLIKSDVFEFVNATTATTQTRYYRLRLWLNDTYTPEMTTVTNGNSHTATIVKKQYKLKVNVIGANGDPITITK